MTPDDIADYFVSLAKSGMKYELAMSHISQRKAIRGITVLWSNSVKDNIELLDMLENCTGNGVEQDTLRHHLLKKHGREGEE